MTIAPLASGRRKLFDLDRCEIFTRPQLRVLLRIGTVPFTVFGVGLLMVVLPRKIRG